MKLSRRETWLLSAILAATMLLGSALAVRYFSRPDLNTAPADVIARAVFNVGPQRAAAIVQERAERGAFSGWDDFAERMAGKDVGPAVVEQCKRATRIGR